MTQRTALCGTTALLVAFSGMAQAEVSASDVWANWQKFYGSVGYELNPGSVTEGSGSVTITDLALTFPNPYADLQEEISVDMKVVIPSVEMRDQNDGSVDIVFSDKYTMVMDIEPAGEEAGQFVVGVDQTGMSMVATGDASLISYDIKGPAVTLSLESVSIPGEEEMNEAFDISATINSIDATYTLAAGDKSDLTMKMTAADLVGLFKVNEPGGDGKFNMDFSFANLAYDSTGTYVAAEKPGDMTSMLKAGFTTEGSMSHGGSKYTIDFADGRDAFSMTGSAASGKLELDMNDQGMGYAVSNTDMAMNMSGSEIPLPEINVTAAASKFGLRMPLLASDDQQDLGMSLRLEGLQVSDMIWGMIDAGGQLPHDPATLIVELAGKANWLYDIMDPGVMETIDSMPGNIHAMDITDLQLSVAGAELTGKGGFTFDNDNLATFGGIPAPTGAVDLRLVGAFGLMDKLVAMGLLPQEQAMGARMMSGLFAKPQGDDDLVSKIEIDGATGAISANGQRLQ